MGTTGTSEEPLVEIAGALYALAPEDFIAARDERAAEVRADGDRDLAARVKKLRKPSAAAWALNQLARREADALAEVEALGGRMRTAQEAGDGPGLRTLGKQLRAAVDGLARSAADLARDAGRPLSGPVGQDVAETLRAVGADPGVAAAVASGLLIASVASTGLDRADVGDVVAVPEVVDAPADDTDDVTATGTADDTTGRPDAAVRDLDAARARKAERQERERREAARRQALAEARRRSEAAASAASQADDEAAAAATALGQAQETLEEARRQVESAESAAAEATERAERARAESDAAAAALDDVEAGREPEG